MKVTLKTLTSGIGEYKDHSPEEILVAIARVSSSREDKFSDYEKLVEYLITNAHWSPFEMVNVCFEIETSRAMSHQLIRHRSFTFQEFSQRYSSPEEVEPVEIRKQAQNNRQSSEEVFDPTIDATLFGIKASQVVEHSLSWIRKMYNELIEAGVAREVARLILPEATKTTIYMNGSLRSWIHFLQVRLDPHAQKEIRLIAQEIKCQLSNEFPITFRTLDKINKKNGV